MFGFLSAFSVAVPFIFTGIVRILVCINWIFFLAFFFVIFCVRFYRNVIFSLVAQCGCQDFILCGQDQFVDGGDLLVEFAVLAFVCEDKALDDLQRIRVFGHGIVQVQVAHIFFAEVFLFYDHIAFFGDYLHPYQAGAARNGKFLFIF